VRVHHFFTKEDIKAIRENLNMTREAFASSFCLRESDVLRWEEGTSQPDTYARALLRVIAKNPKAVLEALQA
jgi:putative transcriptional regulator